MDAVDLDRLKHLASPMVRLSWMVYEVSHQSSVTQDFGSLPLFALLPDPLAAMQAADLLDDSQHGGDPPALAVVHDAVAVTLTASAYPHLTLAIAEPVFKAFALWRAADTAGFDGLVRLVDPWTHIYSTVLSGPPPRTRRGDFYPDRVSGLMRLVGLPDVHGSWWGPGDGAGVLWGDPSLPPPPGD